MSILTTVAFEVVQILKARNETVSVCESSCAGLISSSLVAVPGASAYYVGGCVVYTRISQKAFLNVEDDEMLNIRASTEEYAALNANRTRISLGTTWGLSETGASGPTGNRYGDAAGHACLAISGPVNQVKTLETGEFDRESNMTAFAVAALELFRDSLRS